VRTRRRRKKNSIFGSVGSVFKEFKLQEFCHKEMDEVMMPVNAALCASLKGAQLQAKGRQFPETHSVKFVCGTGRYKIRIYIIEMLLEN